jgi:hypothetical protein
VVPHDRSSRACLYHRADDPQGRKLSWSTIYKVANKNGFPLGMAIGGVALPVTKVQKQSLQLFVMTVHIANDVVTHLIRRSV